MDHPLTASVKTQNLATMFDSVVAAALAYLQSSMPNKLSHLAGDACNIFRADGCAIIEPSSLAKIGQLKLTHKLRGGYPTERIQQLLTLQPSVVNSKATFGPDQGGPAIATHSTIGLLILYRLNAAAMFSDQDAKFVAALWRNCGKAAPVDDSRFSPRLRQVLECLLSGFSDKEIAAQLSISKHTVHVHTKRVYRLIGVGSRPQLLARCLAPGRPIEIGRLVNYPPSALPAYSKMKVKGCQLQPTDQAVPATRPVAAVDCATAHMLLGHRQSASQ